MPNEILVTGARGFSGRHLVAHLRGAGERVLALDLHPGTHPDDVAMDLQDVASLVPLLQSRQPDRVFHLAGAVFEPGTHEARGDLLDLNVGLTLATLDALVAAGLRPRFLLVSSCAVYGVPPARDGVAGEADPAAPVLFYGFTKLAQEELVSTYHNGGLVQALTCRTFNLAGPGEPGHFVTGAVASQVAAGARVIRVGRTETVRDFIDVRDAAEAYALVMERGEPGTVYNVGRGIPVPVGDMIEAVLSAAGSSAPVERDPARVRIRDVSRIVADATRLRALGWAPRHDLAVTVRDTLSALAHTE